MWEYTFLILSFKQKHTIQLSKIIIIENWKEQFILIIQNDFYKNPSYFTRLIMSMWTLTVPEIVQLQFQYSLCAFLTMEITSTIVVTSMKTFIFIVTLQSLLNRCCGIDQYMCVCVWVLVCISISIQYCF